MALKNLVIDDLREFVYPEDFADHKYARTLTEGLEELKAQLPLGGVRFLWLDHDLGMVDGKEEDIMPVVDWLCELSSNETPYPVEMIFIQTSNPYKRTAMQQSLRRWGYKTAIIVEDDDIFVVNWDNQKM